MILDLHRRKGLRALPCVCILLTFLGCGGGGGGGGGGPINPGGSPTPVATAIERPEVEVIVQSGGDINDAIAVHPAGATIVVQGGVYEPIVMTPGIVFGTIFIVAGDEELGQTTIIGQGNEAAISLTGQTNVVIEGLHIIGGDDAGIYAADSDGIEIRNCTVRRATNGVVLERVMTGLLFDTLMYENENDGVQALGTTGFRIVNNTIFGHPGDGIFVGSSPGDAVSVLAGDTLIQNNIIDGNLGVGIKVESGNDGGYFGAYNINNDGYQGIGMGFRDLTGANPLFTFPPPSGGTCQFASCDFHVQIATGGRTSPAIDRGDPDTDPLLIAVLRNRTIRSDFFADGGVVDIGYHYPGGMETPTPFPTTPTPGAGGPTRTPTPTPTS